MKCERCQPLIEDYFDGELEQPIDSQVAAHMESCSACATLGSEIKLEREIYTRYHRDVDVTDALWANVHARIRKEEQNEAPSLFGRGRQWMAGVSALRFSPAIAAALVILTIGITVGVMSYLQSRKPVQSQVAQDDGSKKADPSGGPAGGAPSNGDNGTTTVTPPPATHRPESTVAKKRAPAEVDPNSLVRQAEQKYVAAIAILSRDLDARRKQLDPETRSRFDFALAEIDHTIFATRQAVRGNPSDPIALGYLLTAYSKKVEFLRDTARDEIETSRPF